MPRAPRQRLIRSVLGCVLLVGVFAAIAQLAGVSGPRGVAPGTHLDFASSDTWLVQLPKGPTPAVASASRSLARSGGGGSKVATSAELPGGWYEVSLPGEVSADQAEDQFAAAGATGVEPVVPRVFYDEAVPNAPSTPAAPSTPSAQATPNAVSDPVSAFQGGSFQESLRAGTMRATRLGEQWAIDQASDVDIDGNEAWAKTTGSGTIVAVIDTGVDPNHPDLKGRVLPGKDFSGSDTGATYDAVGHGTAVASIIAGGGVGMAGVAPDARILPLKVYDDSEVGFQMAGYLQAIRYAADNGAKVINISLGCGGLAACYSQPELDALAYAASKGVLVVAAAGNGDASGRGMNNDSPSTPDYPSDYDLPNIVSVTASTRLGSWSTWSNYGPVNVDLAAPGEGILVATPGGGYKTADGTSFSAPYVTGAAALVSAAVPGVTPTDIRAKLLAGVTPIPELSGRIVSGGTLNAAAALASTVSGGGANAVTGPVIGSPKSGTHLAVPPVLSWRLPAGWVSSYVLVKGAGANVKVAVKPGARTVAHPAAAWRSGSYQWQVVARTPKGQSVHTGWSSYTVAPRLAAWVTSGKVGGRGHTLRLRVGYGSTVPATRTRITVLANGRTIHRGASVSRSGHVRGVGSPHRGWFVYDIRTTKSLAVGTKLEFVVQVQAGGTTLTRRFAAKVA
ncbi:MAG: peptidase and in, kexin, sedolisin [Thermoleophilia bacterium]|nr:peptidase and in, kexin, sedolisin [Thermoleophilia bacterium]